MPRKFDWYSYRKSIDPSQRLFMKPQTNRSGRLQSTRRGADTALLDWQTETIAGASIKAALRQQEWIVPPDLIYKKVDGHNRRFYSVLGLRRPSPEWRGADG
jgi:hypothetical protein